MATNANSSIKIEDDDVEVGGIDGKTVWSSKNEGWNVPNLNKSAIFLAGVNPSLHASLAAILHIPMASLPVKYLEVPLITSKISYIECIQLKERTFAGVKSWTSQHLSLGGRVQLIQSVLWPGCQDKLEGSFLPLGGWGLGLKASEVVA
ncbi:hypothetical protein RHMOL_Rhmol04G0145200 [Rhododendron molle]|uniref:Uncharacterized protein n=1 Tax=Rhododendron molle TaxID=49168 RepID=A0ACC0P092_RHOML|nr:hypothetical protein RHMOL_Rhmol04G0145200 [Rhododendron molle]